MEAPTPKNGTNLSFGQFSLKLHVNEEFGVGWGCVSAPPLRSAIGPMSLRFFILYIKAAYPSPISKLLRINWNTLSVKRKKIFAIRRIVFLTKYCGEGVKRLGSTLSFNRYGFLPTTHIVRGKVMFSIACVVLFTVGGGRVGHEPPDLPTPPLARSVGEKGPVREDAIWGGGGVNRCVCLKYC